MKEIFHLLGVLGFWGCPPLLLWVRLQGECTCLENQIKNVSLISHFTEGLSQSVYTTAHFADIRHTVADQASSWNASSRATNTWNQGDAYRSNYICIWAARRRRRANLQVRLRGLHHLLLEEIPPARAPLLLAPHAHRLPRPDLAAAGGALVSFKLTCMRIKHIFSSSCTAPPPPSLPC